MGNPNSESQKAKWQEIKATPKNTGTRRYIHVSTFPGHIPRQLLARVGRPGMGLTRRLKKQ